MTDFAKIDGLATHYRFRPAQGGAPVVVFSNSLGTDFRIWDGVVALLPADFGILLYDKRGHGLSDLGPTPYTIEGLAADLDALLQHLSIARAHICGVSIGGMVAQALYHRRPATVQSLILSNTAAKIGDDAMWNGRIAAIESGGIAALADAILSRWFSAAFRSADNADFAGYANMLLRQSAAGYNATCAALRDADLRPQAGKIAIPALCLAGDEDGATPPELVQELAASIPGARYELISSAGHLPCIEQPEAVARLVAAFVLENHGEHA